MKTRRWSGFIMAITLLFMLGACAGTNTAKTGSPASGDPASGAPAATAAQPSSGSTPGQEESADVRITFMTQEYEGDNISEIPYFEYDGEKNDEADAINRLLNQGLQMRYEEFLADSGNDDGAWIEIRSYPFTDDQYAQVVITNCVYPNVRWGGMVESVNYDKVNNKWIQFSDLGIGEDYIRSEVEKLHVPDYDGAVIDSVNVAGFLLRSQGGEIGDYTEILLEIVTSGGGVDPYTLFYAYCPDTGEFYRFDPAAVVPFSHADMDHVNPPLYYDQFETQTGGEPIADGVIYTGSLPEGDPGDNISALAAATGLYHLVLQDLYSMGSDYSAENPMYIGYGGVLDVEGGECYGFEVSGAFGLAQYAVNYASGYAYEVSESGSKLLGNINDLGKGDF